MRKVSSPRSINSFVIRIELWKIDLLHSDGYGVESLINCTFHYSVSINGVSAVFRVFNFPIQLLSLLWFIAIINVISPVCNARNNVNRFGLDATLMIKYAFRWIGCFSNLPTTFPMTFIFSFIRCRQKRWAKFCSNKYVGSWICWKLIILVWNTKKLDQVLRYIRVLSKL